VVGKRRFLEAVFRAKVALAAAIGDWTTAHLESQFGVHVGQGLGKMPHTRLYAGVGSNPDSCYGLV